MSGHGEDLAKETVGIVAEDEVDTSINLQFVNRKRILEGFNEND